MAESPPTLDAPARAASIPTVVGLTIYPLKSGQGIPVDRVALDRYGPAMDRRWMLVDDRGDFMTQRTHPRMHALEVELLEDGIFVSAEGSGGVHVPKLPPGHSGEEQYVSLWEKDMVAPVVPGDSAAWFSEFMGEECRVLFVPDDRERKSDREYIERRALSFADGYQVLVASRASLDELNRRLDSPVEMRRFRPNVVVDGCGPHEEDLWRAVEIGGLRYRGVKPCPRCVLVTVDPDTGEKGPEPLRTLTGYRRQDGYAWFGTNLVHEGEGFLAVGDTVAVLEVGPPPVGPAGVVAETTPPAEE
jgi:uncharacterized protein YcbX